MPARPPLRVRNVIRLPSLPAPKLNTRESVAPTWRIVVARGPAPVIETGSLTGSSPWLTSYAPAGSTMLSVPSAALAASTAARSVGQSETPSVTGMQLPGPAAGSFPFVTRYVDAACAGAAIRRIDEIAMSSDRIGRHYLRPRGRARYFLP